MQESDLNKTLRVIDIVEGTSVDGPGLRTSIYFAGCSHACPGCHNPSTWDFNAGHNMSIAELLGIIEEAEFPVTLSGGDPLYQAENVAILAREIKSRFGLNIWLYTGFTLEEIKNKPMLSMPLPYIDVVVDGPFIDSMRDPQLLFRGSSNQRIINLREQH